ncbi:MAG: hypothetical protein EWM73_02564 [Nitrospira sp.]|nr:MAG: hypothetical protein EWM73_02564 [Nitrospira sp.]
MHLPGIVAFDEVGDIAVAAEEVIQFIVTDTGQDRRTRDLVAVQMENRQDDAVGEGIQKFIGMPACREGTGFRFPVTDHTGRDQIGIVEYGSVCMRE